MDNFPDPDEVYDLVHEDEFELLKEIEAENTLQNSGTLQQAAESQQEHLLTNINNSSSQQEKQSSSQISKQTPQIVSDVILSGQNRLSVNGYCNNVSKKRTCEELFGDISDILDFDLSEGKSREKRPRWDQPDEIIHKILEARSNLHIEDKHYVSNRKKCTQDKHKDSISLRVPSWNFIAVTRPWDAQRLYVKVRNNKEVVNLRNTKPIFNLLSVPFEQLKAEAEKITEKNMQPVNDISDSPVLINDTRNMNDELWVDKYKPKSYIELLSDESVNRHFLHWLKLWDKIVFNKNVPQLKKREHTKTFFGNTKFGQQNNEVKEIDDKGYPVYRIALLTGPPGLGKTTLAHLAAQHAGYNVVEVNASDERSPDSFRQILLASTQMKAVMGNDPRPNCLVLDEIDGTPAASIDLLLKFVQGKLHPKGKKNKENKATDGCQRPVVCICNEPYTPSLRALRSIALIIPVPEVSPQRLAERLVEIAHKEKLNVSLDNAMKLVERSGCDVRSCLGALQYMGGADLKNNLSVGLKDTRKGLFDSWKEILTIPMNRNGMISLSERVRRILKVAQSGETERLAQGIFHNYPEICHEKLQNVITSLDWFQFFDEVSSLIYNQQVWSLMPYRNYAFSVWHIYLATLKQPKISYPAVVNEVQRKLTGSTAIIASVRRVCGYDNLGLIMDYAPFLPDLLTPRLRTVSGHLLSFKEKADLTHLVNAMLDLGLSFIQEKNSDGGYDYKLDPNIFEIGIFSDCKAHRSLAYAVKQMICQELEVERLRRFAKITGISADSSKEKTEESNKTAKIIKPNTPPEKVYKDFFGRVVKMNPSKQQNGKVQTKSALISSASNTVKEIFAKQGVWYKYKEGFSNAVCRKVSFRDLM